jgi:fatty acid desaturase
MRPLLGLLVLGAIPLLIRRLWREHRSPKLPVMFHPLPMIFVFLGLGPIAAVVAGFSTSDSAPKVLVGIAAVPFLICGPFGMVLQCFFAFGWLPAKESSWMFPTYRKHDPTEP